MSAQGIRAGRAFVQLGTEDSQLTKGLKKAQDAVAKLGSSLTRIGAGITAAGAAITTPIIAAAASFTNTGDALNKMSARTGLSVEALSELGFAAEQSGSDLKTMGDSLFKMNRRIANAAEEGGPAQRALEALGLSAEELTQLSPDKQMEKIADAMADVSDEGFAAQLGFEIFGNGVKDLLPLLQSGSKGMGDLRKQASDLGLTMSGDDANAASEMADSWNILQRSLSRLVDIVGASVAPVLTSIVDMIIPVVTSIIEWADANRNFIVLIAGLGAGLLVAGAAVTTFGIAATAVSIIIGGIATTLGLLVAGGPLLLIVPAIAAVGAALLLLTEDGQAMLGWFREELPKMFEWFQDVLGGIGSALKAGDLEAAAGIAFKAIEVVVKSALANVVDYSKDMVTDVMEQLQKLAKGMQTLFNGLQIIRTKISQILPDLGKANMVFYGPGATLAAKAFDAMGKPINKILNEVEKVNPGAVMDVISEGLKDDAEQAKRELKGLVEEANALAPPEFPKLPDMEKKKKAEEGGKKARQIVGSTFGTFSASLAGVNTGMGQLQQKQLDVQQKIERNTRDLGGTQQGLFLE